MTDIEVASTKASQVAATDLRTGPIHRPYLRWISPVVLLLAWQLIVPLLPTELLPLPSDVAVFMWNELRGETRAPYSVYENFAVSLARLGIGLSVAMVLGIALGVIMGLSHKAEGFFHDLVTGGVAIPHLIYALMFTIWLGYHFMTPVIVVILAGTPLMMLNVAEGMRSVPRELVDMGHAYRVPRWRLTRHLVIPSLLPFIFAGARYSLSIGWKSLVIAEVFGAQIGAGWMLEYWHTAYSVTGLLAYTGFFILFTVVVDQLLFNWLNGYLFRWRAARSVL